MMTEIIISRLCLLIGLVSLFIENECLISRWPVFFEKKRTDLYLDALFIKREE